MAAAFALSDPWQHTGLREEAPASGEEAPVLEFQFYAHLTIGGDSPSEWGSAPGDPNRNSFGRILVFDDALTVGADPASAPLGRVRGYSLNTAGATGTSNSTLTIAFTFDTESVSGSLIVAGTSNKLIDVRELAVVGGTGAFRYARGVATQAAVSSSVDATTGQQSATNVWRVTLESEAAISKRVAGLAALQEFLPPVTNA